MKGTFGFISRSLSLTGAVLCTASQVSAQVSAPELVTKDIASAVGYDCLDFTVSTSQDGRYVAYRCEQVLPDSEELPTPDPDYFVAVLDRSTGQVTKQSLTGQEFGYEAGPTVKLSADGSTLSFSASNLELTGQSPNERANFLFRRNLRSGETVNITPVGNQTVGVFTTNGDALSTDGNRVGFAAFGGPGSPGPSTVQGRVYDRASNSIINATDEFAGNVINPKLSGNGNVFGFTAAATGFGLSCGNNCHVGAVRDISANGPLEVITRANDGSLAPSGGFLRAISNDGREVVFEANGNLAPGAPERTFAWVRDRASGTTKALFSAKVRSQLDDTSSFLATTGDLRFVLAWTIQLNNAGNATFVNRMFWIDRATDTVVPIHTRVNRGLAQALEFTEGSLSGDGKLVIFSTKSRVTAADTDSLPDSYAVTISASQGGNGGDTGGGSNGGSLKAPGAPSVKVSKKTATVTAKVAAKQTAEVRLRLGKKVLMSKKVSRPLKLKNLKKGKYTLDYRVRSGVLVSAYGKAVSFSVK